MNTKALEFVKKNLQHEAWCMMPISHDIEPCTCGRDEAIAVLSYSEKCMECGQSWSPSLVESGTCIFCIAKHYKLLSENVDKRIADARFNALTEVAEAIEKYGNLYANVDAGRHYSEQCRKAILSLRDKEKGGEG